MLIAWGLFSQTRKLAPGIFDLREAGMGIGYRVKFQESNSERRPERSRLIQVWALERGTKRAKGA